MKLKNKKQRKKFYLLLSLVLSILIVLNTFLIVKYNVLPFKYLIVYIIAICIIPLSLMMYTLFKKKNRKLKSFFGGIEVLYIVVLFIAFFYLNSTFNFLDKFSNNTGFETKKYYVLVLENSDYNKIDDLNNKSIGYANGLDESVSDALSELDKKVKITHEKYEGYDESLNKLKDEDVESVLIIQNNYDMIIENSYDMLENTKIIYEFSIREKANNLAKKVNVTKEPFNIYISGIDSYGNITDKNKSDVNIVASVNPKTHKVLLINIPRDYYVNLGGINQMDKLTHAGAYGVKTSVKTIEELLDIELNYYVKVNYNALINLVNALGGVDVYSEYDFSSYEYHHKFKKGYNTVDGKLALDFVRTRKAFLDGDRVRGENQQRMIEAIAKKACTPAILIKYDSILKSLDGTFITNMPTEDVTSLIKMQLDKMPEWSIEKLSLNGSDAYEYTYSAKSQELYVMIPNEETVDAAKDALERIKNGE